MKIIPPKRSGDGYRKYKPTFCRSREASYPKAPHPFVVQVTVLAVGPAQIALIRVGLTAKSLAAGTLDVSGPAGRCETCSVSDNKAQAYKSRDLLIFIFAIEVCPVEDHRPTQ